MSAPLSLLKRLQVDRIHAVLLPAESNTTEGRRNLWQHLLSRYLDCSPAELPLHYSATGKPELRPPTFDFSISHTQDRLVVLLSLEGPVGIDLESLHRQLPWQKLAERFFCPEEAATLAAAPSDEARRQAFLRLWTRKEAFVKATGKGIADQLKTFRVDQERLQIFSAGQWQESREWSIQNLEMGDEWICSVAVPRSLAGREIPVL